MTDQIVQASEALRHARYAIIPALCGCPSCGEVRMIASPELGTCTDCKVALVELPRKAAAPAAPIKHAA